MYWITHTQVSYAGKEGRDQGKDLKSRGAVSKRLIDHLVDVENDELEVDDDIEEPPAQRQRLVDLQVDSPFEFDAEQREVYPPSIVNGDEALHLPPSNRDSSTCT